MPSNDLGPFVPEVWAQDALMILEEELVVANLVQRNHSDVIQDFGDTVNIPAPARFKMVRKGADDNVTVQAATAAKIPVVLNQHGHISFNIKDSEQSKSYKDLYNQYLIPQIKGLARGIEETILGEKYNFINNIVGQLGSPITRSTMVGATELMDQLKIPPGEWNMVVSTGAKGDLLSIPDFTDADRVADGGRAIRTANIGGILGFNIYMTQLNRQISAGSTLTEATVNLSGGYDAGTTAVVCSAFDPDPVPGEWCTIGGDMTPQFITDYVASTNTLTISPGLQYAVDNGAAVKVYVAGAINEGDGYGLNYAKTMAVNGFTVAPKLGQLMSFGTSVAGRELGGVLDSVSSPTTTTLDSTQALATAKANAALVGLGPAGDYSWLFQRDAVALVSRPLATPRPEFGAKSFVVSYGGLSFRITMQYQGTGQGLLVTGDLLYGVKTLDANRGALLLAG